MKTLAILLTLTLVTSQLVADDGAWHSDLPKGLEQAKTEHKWVLLDFTGSDWCPPCKKLHSTVLTSEEFTQFAKEHLVLVELDFPKHKAQTPELKATNRELSKKYEIKGFPTIIVLDADGKELFKEVGYGGASATDYVAKLKQLVK